MKLVLTLLVRDEEDVLETLLRYHLEQGVDFVIATDNRSVDATPEILHRFEREGCLKLIDERGDDYSQSAWVTRRARMAHEEHAADWVIHGDADEFWWPKSGNLREALASLPSEADVVRASRVNFLPGRGAAGAAVEEMLVREVSSRSFHGHPLPGKVGHRGRADVIVAQGNHSVEAPGLTAPAHSEPIVIFHFPIRSYRQFENKIRKGGEAYARNTELPPTTGTTWRDLYQLLEAGKLRAYFDEQQLDDAQVARGIESGELILDRRLRSFLCRHGIAKPGTAIDA